MLNMSEDTWITATVEKALDQSLPLSRKTVGLDSYGHSTETYAQVSTLVCTVSKPTATQLELFAEIIAGQKAMMLRYMPTSDVREGDRIVYAGLNWTVQPVRNAASYSFTNSAVITAVT